MTVCRIHFSESIGHLSKGAHFYKYQRQIIINFSKTDKLLFIIAT